MQSKNKFINNALLIWQEFWFSKIDPVSIGMFRIFIGLLMIAYFLCLAPSWNTYYSSNGIVSLKNSPHFQIPGDWWCLFSWTESMIPVSAFWWVAFIAVILFTIGLYTRLSTIVLFLIHSSMVFRAPIVVNGEDFVFRMLLFYGCFASLGQDLSVDRWRKSGTVEKIEIWPIRLMQINIVLIYAIALPNRLASDVSWWNGDAVYLSVASDMWGRWPWPHHFALFHGLLSKVATYGTILVEGLFPFTVWFRKARFINIIALIFLHAGIALVLNNVVFFSLSMICSFWVFAPPYYTRAFLSKIRQFIPAIKLG